MSAAAHFGDLASEVAQSRRLPRRVGAQLGEPLVAIRQLGSQLMAVTVGADKTAALWQVRENGLSLVGPPKPSYGGSFLECLHLRSDSWAAS